MNAHVREVIEVVDYRSPNYTYRQMKVTFNWIMTYTHTN